MALSTLCLQLPRVQSRWRLTALMSFKTTSNYLTSKFKAGTLPLQAYRKENTVPTDMQSEVEDEPDSVPVLEEILFADEYGSSSESDVGDEADGEDEIEEHVHGGVHLVNENLSLEVGESWRCY